MHFLFIDYDSLNVGSFYGNFQTLPAITHFLQNSV